MMVHKNALPGKNGSRFLKQEKQCNKDRHLLTSHRQTSSKAFFADLCITLERPCSIPSVFLSSKPEAIALKDTIYSMLS